MSATIYDNVVRANAAAMRSVGIGGGIYLCVDVDTGSKICLNTVDNNNAGFGVEGFGGGIYLDNATASVTGNDVYLNIAAPGDATTGRGEGGGMYVNGGAGLVAGNTISRNIGLVGVTGGMGRGGGMVISNSLVIVQDNLLIQNTAATAPNAAAAGGGMPGSIRGAPHILDNDVLSNTTGGGLIGVGGGFYLEEATPTVERNIVLGNQSTNVWGRGGGIRIAFSPMFTLTNNIVAHNGANQRGSGIASRVAAWARSSTTRLRTTPQATASACT